MNTTLHAIACAMLGAALMAWADGALSWLMVLPCIAYATATWVAGDADPWETQRDV